MLSHLYGAAIARTIPVTGQSLIVLDHIAVDNSVDPDAFAWLEQLPSTTTLILIPSSFDQRLKLCRWLKSLGTLHRFDLPNEWKADEIEAVLMQEAKTLGIKLSQPVRRYLVKAIGGDTARMHAELSKIVLYAQSKTDTLPLADIQRLVPNYNQNVWQLAEAIAQGDTAQVIALTQSLLVTQHSNALIYPLVSRFRTWLWVKAALSNRTTRRPDLELAKLCDINNPNRLYYLKRDVAKWRLIQLVAAVQHLVTLQ